MIKKFTKNPYGRDIAVGDIHGNYSGLMAALDSIGFSVQHDRLFSVGDIVDRGIENELCVQLLDRPWFHAVCGNHEDIAITHVKIAKVNAENYIKNGGAWFLGLSSSEQEEIATSFQQLPIAIEIETDEGIVGIIHADCPTKSWSDFKKILELTSAKKTQLKQITNICFWSRERIESNDTTPVEGLRALIVGHTPVAMPGKLGNVIHIDTMGWRKEGYFTFIDIQKLELITSKPSQ